MAEVMKFDDFKEEGSEANAKVSFRLMESLSLSSINSEPLLYVQYSLQIINDAYFFISEWFCNLLCKLRNEKSSQVM